MCSHLFGRKKTLGRLSAFTLTPMAQRTRDGRPSDKGQKGCAAIGLLRPWRKATNARRRLDRSQRCMGFSPSAASGASFLLPTGVQWPPSRRPEAKSHPRPKTAAISARFTR